jgi:hypothetical protein
VERRPEVHDGAVAVEEDGRGRVLVGERADHADAALLVRLGHVRDPPAAGAPLDSDGPRRAWQRVRGRGTGRCSRTRSFTGHRHAANVRVLAHFVARASVGRGVRPVHGPKLDKKFYDPIFNFVKPKFTSGLPVLEDLSSGITSSRRSLPRAFSECRCRDRADRVGIDCFAVRFGIGLAPRMRDRGRINGP